MFDTAAVYRQMLTWYTPADDIAGAASGVGPIDIVVQCSHSCEQRRVGIWQRSGAKVCYSHS